MIHACASSAGGSIVERLIAWYFRAHRLHKSSVQAPASRKVEAVSMLNWVNVSKDAACASARHVSTPAWSFCWNDVHDDKAPTESASLSSSNLITFVTCFELMSNGKNQNDIFVW